MEIIDFLTSVPEEDAKRITAYLKANPKTEISVEGLSTLNNVLKQQGFESAKETSLEERLSSAKTLSEREAIMAEADLWRDPRFGNAKITPPKEAEPLARGSRDIEGDETWAQDSIWFEEFKKERPELGL